MERLTFFTAPRPFAGLYSVIQTNAITSWTLLEPRPHIILIGNDPGIAEIAGEAGLEHVPEVEGVHDPLADSWLPYVRATFAIAEERAVGKWMCRINADIILMQDFMEAFGRLRAELDRFLMVGRRHTLAVTEVLDFLPGWQDELRARVADHGKADPRTGIDYFVYPRGLYPQKDFPAFLQARQGCDGWLHWYAQKRAKVPTVEVTQVVLAVHQDHKRTRPYLHAEIQANRALANKHLLRLWDCSHSLRKDGLKQGTWPR